MRALAAVGLAIWDKPAAACLSSRIPYGTSVTRERLTQIGGLEAALKGLGFRQVRVRYHGDLARIEHGAPELARAAEPAVRDAIVEAAPARTSALVKPASTSGARHTGELGGLEMLEL